MKKAMKTIVSVLLTAGMLIPAAACGSDGGNAYTDPSEKAEITFYVWDELSKFEDLSAQFKEIYPNWTVEVREIAGDYFDNLKAYFGADAAPDIFYIEQGEIQQFLADDLILNLSPYLKESETLSESDLWSANDGYRYDPESGKLGDGDLYAFNKDITADFCMVYNRSHIDEYNAANAVPLNELIGYPVEEGTSYPSESVPMTWEQNENFCRALAKFDTNDNLLRYGTVFDYLPWKHVMEWVQMTGSSLFSEDGKTFNADDPNVVAAFEHLTNYQFGEKKSAVPLDVNSTGSAAGFKNGDVSVVWYGRYAWQAFNWYECDFEIGIAPPPVPTASSPAYSACSPVGLSVKSNSEYPYVAYKFLEFVMTTGAVQTIKSGTTFNLPGNKTIAGGSAFLNPEDPVQKKLNNYFYEMTSQSKPIVYSPYIDTSSMIAIFGLEYGKTWDSSASTRLTAEAALTNCKSKIEAHISKYLERL